DLAAIDTPISYEDQALLLLTYLPSSYDNFVETLLYGQDTLKLEDMVPTLNSTELQKITEAKGDGGEGLYVSGKSSQRDMEQGIITGNNLKVLSGMKIRYPVLKLMGNAMYRGQTEDTTMYTYLVNMSPSTTIEFKTPIDMLGVLVGLLVLSNGCLNWLRSSAYSWDTVKIGLKDDMDARTDVYVHRNSCKKCSDDNDGYYLQTLLEGHSILSLEGSLSGDCNVVKNDVQVFVDFDYTIGRSITVMGRSITRNSGVHDTYEGCKGGYLANGTRNRVKIRAKDSSEYCYRCLVKGYPWSKVPT
nr:retrovirus-related Pol polyprotein from transposon TNT 1-94 [Tanacetum cinerariifolium]